MAKGNGAQDPRVTSLDEARRKKAEQEQAAKRAAKAATGGTLGQRAFGLAMIAMAIGFIVWMFGGLGNTTIATPPAAVAPASEGTP